MFRKYTGHVGPLSEITYYHSSHRCAMSVVPGYGANIRSLVLTAGTQTISLIEGAPSYEALVSDAAFRSAFLLPWPNRIKDGRYHSKSGEHQLPINEIARHHAIHGFLYRYPFTIESERLGDEEAEIILKNTYNGDYPGFPFAFQTTIQLNLSLSGQLKIRVYLANSGERPMPAGIGWHPYYTFGEKVDQYELKMPKCMALELDPRCMPTGKQKPADFRQPQIIGDTRFDSTFLLADDEEQASTFFIDTERKILLEAWQDNGPYRFQYLQLYIPKHRNSLAIEPMTCPIDAFNADDDKYTVQPGEGIGGEFGVKLEQMH